MCGDILADVLGPKAGPLELNKLFAAEVFYWASQALGDETSALRLLQELEKLGETAGKMGVVHPGYEVDMGGGVGR